MSASGGELRDLVREVAAEDRRGNAAHPSADELVAYQADELPASDRDRVRRHLAHCPACVTAVLDLESFPEVPRVEVDPGADRLRAEDWRSLAVGLGLQVDAPAGSRVSFYRAAAAALLLVALGLGGWAISLQRQVAELSAPRANVLVHDLLPLGEGELRDDAAGESLDIPRGTEQVVLILNSSDLHRHDRYRVEIVDREGAVVWRRDGLVRLPEGSFSIAVEREVLDAGTYRLRLLAADAEATTVLATYVLRVRPGGP